MVIPGRWHFGRTQNGPCKCFFPRIDGAERGFELQSIGRCVHFGKRGRRGRSTHRRRGYSRSGAAFGPSRIHDRVPHDLRFSPPVSAFSDSRLHLQDAFSRHGRQLFRTAGRPTVGWSFWSSRFAQHHWPLLTACGRARPQRVLCQSRNCTSSCWRDDPRPPRSPRARRNAPGGAVNAREPV